MNCLDASYEKYYGSKNQILSKIFDLPSTILRLQVLNSECAQNYYPTIVTSFMLSQQNLVVKIFFKRGHNYKKILLSLREKTYKK